MNFVPELTLKKNKSSVQFNSNENFKLVNLLNNIPLNNLPKMDSLIEISWNKTQQEYFCLKNLYLIFPTIFQKW